jgi:hypothetical protein
MPARGTYGDFSPGRGDITGRKFLNNAGRKQDRDQAKRATANALAGDEPCELVSVGPRAYLVPKVAADAIRAAEN